MSLLPLAGWRAGFGFRYISGLAPDHGGSLDQWAKKLSLKHFLYAGLVLLAPVVPTGASAQVTTHDTLPAVLAPGDVVRITVWRHPELSGDFIVSPDSSIAHPLLREVKVAGVPLSSVEGRVHDFLVRFDATPAFVISPLLRVFVGGEIRTPSVYNVPPGSTISQLLAIAGGPTDRAKLEEVALVRNQQRTLLDLRLPESRIATLEVRSGDQILIARRRSFWTDILAPLASIVGAAASLTSIIIQVKK